MPRHHIRSTCTIISTVCDRGCKPTASWSLNALIRPCPAVCSQVVRTKSTVCAAQCMSVLAIAHMLWCFGQKRMRDSQDARVAIVGAMKRRRIPAQELAAMVTQLQKDRPNERQAELKKRARDILQHIPGQSGLQGKVARTVASDADAKQPEAPQSQQDAKGTRRRGTSRGTPAPAGRLRRRRDTSRGTSAPVGRFRRRRDAARGTSAPAGRKGALEGHPCKLDW